MKSKRYAVFCVVWVILLLGPLPASAAPLLASGARVVESWVRSQP